MNPVSPGIPVVRAILALFMVIVGLLGWMLAGATLLVGGVEGVNTDPAVVWFSIPLSTGYLVLAWGILRQRPWGFWLALVLLCGVLTVGIADLERPGLMALDSTLTMLSAVVSSMAAIVALSFPTLERMIASADSTENRPGSE